MQISLKRQHRLQHPGLADGVPEAGLLRRPRGASEDLPSQTQSQTLLCCACTFILHKGARWEKNQQSHQGERILLQPLCARG